MTLGKRRRFGGVAGGEKRFRFGTNRGRGPINRFRRNTFGGGRGGSLAKAVKREFDKRVEWKKSVTENEDLDMKETGAVLNLSQPIQGLKDTERVGDAIRATSLGFKWQIKAATAGASCQGARVIIFTWKPNTTPVIGSILNPGGAVGHEHQSEYNTDNALLYKIHFDKTVRVASDTGNSMHCVGGQVKIRIPDDLRDIKFEEASAIGSNKKYMLRLSDITGGLWPQLSFSIKLNYSDS